MAVIFTAKDPLRKEIFFNISSSPILGFKVNASARIGEGWATAIISTSLPTPAHPWVLLLTSEVSSILWKMLY